MKKSQKVKNHQLQLKKYKKLLYWLKNGKKRKHEAKDTDYHFGIPRRTMRWKAKTIQGGWREERE